MVAADWIKFFHDLPITEHEIAIVSLENGTEIAIGRIMKFTELLMIVRGRLGGTDDADRIFCIPFGKIQFVFFSRVQNDEKVVECFGEIIGGIKRAYLTDPAEEAKKKAEEEAAAAEALEPSPDALPANDRPPPANVSALRSRLLQNRSKRIDPRTRSN